MQKQGYAHIVVTVTIALIAVLMVGVAWYYDANRDETATNVAVTNTPVVNTNAPATANANTTVNENVNVPVVTNTSSNTNTTVNTNMTLNTNAPTNTNTAVNVNASPGVPQAYFDDPQYCASDEDCVVAESGCNSCYKKYFNLYATTEIEEYENFEGMCKQDCPPFSDVAVCIDNLCQGSLVEEIE